MTLSELWSEARYRLRALVHRRGVERELDDELRFHIEHEAEKLVRAGLSRDDALRRARLAFGGVSRVKDDSRDARGVSAVEHVTQDVRYALRGIRMRPMFTAVVVATLGLGVGVNAAMFGILDRLLFRPPAYLIDPASVNRVYVDWTATDGRRIGFSRRLQYTRYTDFVRWSRSFSSTAAFSYRALAVGDGEDARELIVGAVSASFFDFFSATPALGRFFTIDEDRVPVGDAVAVISFGYWQSRYAGRVDVIGKTLTIDRGTYRIIGVAPPSFDGVSDGRPPVAFIPATTFGYAMRPAYYRNYNWDFVELLVRRRSGVSVASATADLSNAFRLSWDAERAVNPTTPAVEVVRPAAVAAPILLSRGPMAGPDAKVVIWIGGVAFVVLLIACANVANLLLARSLRRRREMAVRRAIGGTRGRLIQQILTEALVLAGLGTIAGVLAAQLCAGVLQRLLIASAEPVPVVTDGRTGAFAIVMMVLTALLAGGLPSLHVGHGDLAGSLRAGARDGAYRQSRARTTLLVFQTALSVVLLVGAGLFVRSLVEVRATRLGYDVDRLVYVQTAMRGVKVTPAENSALVSRLLAESRSTPGVANASVTVSIPFLGGVARNLFVAGIDSVKRLGKFLLQAGSPEYFATLGTRVVRGRGLSASDRANAPNAVVVSAAMASVLWPHQDPIGKCIRIESDTMPCTTVVGVAENIKARDIRDDSELAYYLPIDQYTAELQSPAMIAAGYPIEPPALFVRVRGRPDDFVETLRARLQRVMPGASYVTVVPMHEIVDPAMRSWTSGADMFLALGTLALTLAAVGLYATIAFAVAQRTQELGVRIALGARAGDVLRLIVGDGLRVTLAGVVIGGVIALVAGRSLGPLLFRVSPHDPLVFGGVVVALLAVGMLASLIPASRAARVDPNIALRAE
jgi:predicted permease